LSIFRKHVEKIQAFIKLLLEERVLYMKTSVHSWQYLAEFFLEREAFHQKL